MTGRGSEDNGQNLNRFRQISRKVSGFYNLIKLIWNKSDYQQWTKKTFL